MKQLKFRQALIIDGKFHSFHFWGFISEDYFVAPICGVQEALKNSEQLTDRLDKNSKEIWGGDIIKFIKEIKFCPKCETEMSVIDKFCSKCGNEITDKDKTRIALCELKDNAFKLCWKYDEFCNQAVPLSEYWIKNEKLEVIGNIYENSNLLN